MVLGLSGGIDSAVTASSPPLRSGADQRHRRRDADALLVRPQPARRRGARARSSASGYEVVPIDASSSAISTRSLPSSPGLAPDVAEENIQARVRGGILMAMSNKFGALLLTTGNKSEIAVGYCTLYGDMAGGLAVISDVPKTFVYRLARHINARGDRPVIPESSLTKAPSAELRPNQTDQDSLPPYDVLDRIVEAYVERNLDVDAIAAAGIDRATVARRASPSSTGTSTSAGRPRPGLKITSKAFGVGRRYPVARG